MWREDAPLDEGNGDKAIWGFEISGDDYRKPFCAASEASGWQSYRSGPNAPQRGCSAPSRCRKPLIMARESADEWTRKRAAW